MKIRLFCMIALLLAVTACTAPPGENLFGLQNPPDAPGAGAAIDKA